MPQKFKGRNSKKGVSPNGKWYAGQLRIDTDYIRQLIQKGVSAAQQQQYATSHIVEDQKREDQYSISFEVKDEGQVKNLIAEILQAISILIELIKSFRKKGKSKDETSNSNTSSPQSDDPSAPNINIIVQINIINCGNNVEG